jgi:hypothetical protein
MNGSSSLGRYSITSTEDISRLNSNAPHGGLYMPRVKPGQVKFLKSLNYEKARFFKRIARV